jgi:hypothetical protein
MRRSAHRCPEGEEHVGEGYDLAAGRAPGEGAAGADPQSDLLLDQASRDLLEPEIDQLLVSIHDDELRERFSALRAAVAAGRVGSDCLPALEQLLALGIETGRFEKVHGRAADTLARGLYGRTPAGKARAEQAAAVNRALAALAGAVLEALTFTADGPAGYRLTLETDRGEVSVRIDRAGVRVESVGVGV